MPVNGLTIGNDCKLTFIDSVQGLLTFANITMVNIAQIVQALKSVSLDGTTRYAELPEGWSAQLGIDAADGRLMDYAARADANFHTFGILPQITFQQTVSWADGSVTAYQYQNGTFALTDAGKFTGNEIVKQSLAMKFSTVQKVA